MAKTTWLGIISYKTCVVYYIDIYIYTHTHIFIYIYILMYIYGLKDG